MSILRKLFDEFTVVGLSELGQQKFDCFGVVQFGSLRVGRVGKALEGRVDDAWRFDDVAVLVALPKRQELCERGEVRVVVLGFELFDLIDQVGQVFSLIVKMMSEHLNQKRHVSRVGFLDEPRP